MAAKFVMLTVTVMVMEAVPQGSPLLSAVILQATLATVTIVMTPLLVTTPGLVTQHFVMVRITTVMAKSTMILMVMAMRMRHVVARTVMTMTKTTICFVF